MKPYQEYQESFLKSRSIENEIPVALCNRTGTERDLTFFGESAIYNSLGQNHIKMGNKPDIQTVEVQIKAERDPNLQYIENRRPISYQDLTK
jgi:predicted amidohydrolase